MPRPIAAALLYAAIALAAGFVLGVMRVTIAQPAFGEMAAVLLEMPVILALSWLACLYVIRRIRVAKSVSARFAMGAGAFTLLMAAELALGAGLMNRPLSDQFALMTSPAGLVGLGGQILFALFPIIALAVRR